MEGLVLRRDEGEEVATLPNRSVLIKADLEQLTVTESWYGSRQNGAARHIHKQHADSFYVLDGELTFLTGSDPVTAPTGAVFLAPPEVVHGFDHERDAEVRFLNFHTPDRGFAESMRARREPGYDPTRYDTFDPPEDAPAGVVVTARGEGDHLAGEKRVATIKIARDELAFVEFELGPGFEGPQAHVHKRHVDSFYVVDGEAEFRVGDEKLRLGVGSFVAAPPGVVHSFSNPGPGRARLINIHAPSCAFHEYLNVMDAAEAGLDEAMHAKYDVYEVD